MTPRKASLRVAHQATCKQRPVDEHGRRSEGPSTLVSLQGCTCKPSFYTFYRGRDGKPVKGERVKNRAVAQRALNALQVEIDEQRVGLSRPKQLTFNEWADEYESIVEGRVRAGDLKPRTLAGYRESIGLARTAFGDVELRALGPVELRAFDGLSEGQRPASRLRHLRQLGACLAAAADEGHLTVNPLPVFVKKLKLRAPRRGKAPFEVGELERLWSAFRAYEPVYLYAARLAVETGARLGELVALDWPNVDLTTGQVRIEHTWDAEAGAIPPKSGEARVVYLTPEARAVLEEWVAIAGVQDEGPVFPNPFGGGRLERRMVQRRLALAMSAAGVPRVHPELRLPRSFHSLRYSTSVLMQLRGKHPRLIEQTLGHGSLELTYGVYGGWTPAQLQEEASREPGQP